MSATADHATAEESNEEPSPLGYPKLARMMSVSSEAAIFRRFGKLNMINLLRLQAELHDLEYQLEEIRGEDGRSKDPVREGYIFDFRLMKDWVKNGDSLQHDLLVSIGRKLERYNAALAQTAELNKAPKPTSREIQFLRNWLIRPSSGNSFLNDREKTIWDASNTPDLITLLPNNQENDTFTALLNGILVDIYHSVYGHKQPSSIYAGEKITTYSDAHIMALSNIISSAMASLLPTLVILVLYFVKRMLVKIGLVIVFTAVFSLALSLFTAARKAEIFAATAAFAAVEVVFIGSTNNTS